MSIETYKLEQTMSNLAGGRSVYRADVLGGVLINYNYMADYTLETRVTRDGRYAFMIGKSGYKSANDIPATYRKGRRIAGAIESNLRVLVHAMEGVN